MHCSSLSLPRLVMSTSPQFMFKNGIVYPSAEIPPVTTLLESHCGAYTTARAHNDGSQVSVLFWERHLRRLCSSASILLNSKPQFLFGPQSESTPVLNTSRKMHNFDSVICSLVNYSMSRALPVVLDKRACKRGEDLAITALLCGNYDKLHNLGNIEVFNEEIIRGVFDVYLHVSAYVPPVFGGRGHGAHLAVVGNGREAANAKYSDWVRLRKPLEKLRSPLITELLLSNNGDRILEGCLTNFFVVCLKDESGGKSSQSGESFELQTAPLNDGVLPGVARDVIIDMCLENGIPLREVAPSWSQRDLWIEAFISNSLRLIQHVERIEVPSSWESLESKTWKDIQWEEKCFVDIPGRITSAIQEFLSKLSNICWTHRVLFNVENKSFNIYSSRRRVLFLSLSMQVSPPQLEFTDCMEQPNSRNL